MERTGPGTLRRAPGDGSVKGVIKLKDARAVTEVGQRPTIPGREGRPGDRDELAGGQIEEQPTGARQIAEAGDAAAEYEVAPVGAQFGVMLVIIEGEPFEVATFRHDGPYLDGRRPAHVRYGSLQEDILRRDFTINGMVYDPIGDRVIDNVGGQSDLENRVVRAIGSPRARFEEDRLRILRAVRFAASLGFAVESETLRAICDLAPGIGQISWERIGDEITRILTEGGAKAGFDSRGEADKSK